MTPEQAAERIVPQAFVTGHLNADERLAEAERTREHDVKRVAAIIREALADRDAELAVLKTWQADQQQALIRISVLLLDAGYKGDGCITGVKWLAAQLTSEKRRAERVAGLIEKYRDRAQDGVGRSDWAAQSAFLEAADELEAALEAKP